MSVEVRQRQMIYRNGRLWDRLSVGIAQEEWLRKNIGGLKSWKSGCIHRETGPAGGRRS